MNVNMGRDTFSSSPTSLFHANRFLFSSDYAFTLREQRVVVVGVGV